MVLGLSLGDVDLILVVLCYTALQGLADDSRRLDWDFDREGELVIDVADVRIVEGSGRVMVL